MLENVAHWYEPGERCALCGRVLREKWAGEGWVTYCPRCGIEFPPAVDGYNRAEDYITPEGRFEFSYEGRGKWRRFDMWDGDTDLVKEEDLPGDLVLLLEWRAQEAQHERVAALFGKVEQLSLLVDGRR